MEATAEGTDCLVGNVERVTFHNPENGFCVLRVDVRGQTELQTVVGFVPMIDVGSYIECAGHWFQDKQYGLQFKAKTLKTHLPESLEGITRYLGSGLIKGIGPAFAKQIVAKFGNRSFEIIEQNPDALRHIPQIGEKRIARIRSSWAEQKHIRELLIFLQGHGIGAQRVTRIYKVLGEGAIEKIKADPYCLAMDVRGIGFKTADQLAQGLGLPADSVSRMSAGLLHTLQEVGARGHSVIPHEDLLSGAATLLALSAEQLLVGLDAICSSERVLSVLKEDKACYILPALYHSERSIAKDCVRLLSGDLPWQCSPEVLSEYLSHQRFPLSVAQKEAVISALTHKMMILTGGPGVGKTTIVRQIIRLVKSLGCDITLAAPTGRAAKRLSETTGFIAKTVHRLLRYDPTQKTFSFNRDAPLPTDFLVIDESSMLDIYLMTALLKAIPDHAGVLIVGDVDQLPSVGPGLVLFDLIQSELIPTVRLTEIFRQAKSSKIIQNAHRINEGVFPFGLADLSLEKEDFYLIPTEKAEQTFDKILSLVSQDIPERFGFDPITQIQVLTPSRRSALGSVSLNSALQPILNRKGARSPFVERFGTRYAEGDKVIQLVNNYDKEVFNGDVGFIVSVDLEMSTLMIAYEGREVEYEFSELDEIQLAYAITIHKSQGSEYPVVVIPMGVQHFMLLERNLLYTGVTRGKKLVVLVGEKRAISIACRTLKAKHRLTYLPECLKSVKQ